AAFPTNLEAKFLRNPHIPLCSIALILPLFFRSDGENGGLSFCPHQLRSVLTPPPGTMLFPSPLSNITLCFLHIAL
ncbi:MAG: hypothetical protein MJ077_10905, partial [Oscillospiraceae bacterium]|nr:hypothetical protein [Oscillospiraceae bacterium]